MNEPSPAATFPRKKRRYLALSAAYRAYSHLRPLLPRRWLSLRLLDAAWLLRSLAWEQSWYWLGPQGAEAILRPNLKAFLREHVFPGASVIDMGGGSGIASRAVADLASRVLYVDMNEKNLQTARLMCQGSSNITFTTGDAFTALAERGPFEVALLFHLLGLSEDPVSALATVRLHAKRALIEVPDFTGEPLNHLRLLERRPAHSDAGYVVEFGCEDLVRCAETAGWHVTTLRVRDGSIMLAVDA